VLVVLKPGRHVVCAVSGVLIPLEGLRYWNPELQEAYAGPAEALKPGIIVRITKKGKVIPFHPDHSASSAVLPCLLGTKKYKDLRPLNGSPESC